MNISTIYITVSTPEEIVSATRSINYTKEITSERTVAHFLIDFLNEYYHQHPAGNGDDDQENFRVKFAIITIDPRDEFEAPLFFVFSSDQWGWDYYEVVPTISNQIWFVSMMTQFDAIDQKGIMTFLEGTNDHKTFHDDPENIMILKDMFEVHWEATRDIVMGKSDNTLNSGKSLLDRAVDGTLSGAEFNKAIGYDPNKPKKFDV